ncbi:MAG: hypothetical protein ACK5YP_11940, partial [Betaproteobacteria bacterium]
MSAPGARLRWRLWREFSRFGWQGLAGLALLAAALVLWLGAWRPDEERAQRLRADVAELRARLRASGESASPGSAAPPASRSVQLATFHEFFPQVATLPDWLAVLHSAAARNRLVLESGSYALVPPRGEQRLWRYEMSLPVKGTWPQLRGFVSDLLEQMPAAGLENVVLRRETAGAEQVEAKFDFVLWLGGGHDAWRRGRGPAAPGATTGCPPRPGSDPGAPGAPPGPPIAGAPG